MSCTIAMVTNWCFPCFEQLDIDGCEQLVHLPHCDVRMVPFDVAVVYRPKRGQRAIVFFVRSVGRDQLVTECPVGSIVPVPENC